MPTFTVYIFYGSVMSSDKPRFGRFVIYKLRNSYFRRYCLTLIYDNIEVSAGIRFKINREINRVIRSVPDIRSCI